MKKNLIIAALLVFGFGSVAFAAPYFIQQRSLVPVDSTENIGTTTAPWDVGFFNQLCLSADCKTAWPTGAISTSSPLVSGQSVYATGVNTIASAANLLWNNATSLFTLNGTLTVSSTTATSTFNGFTTLATTTTSMLNGVIVVDGVHYPKTGAGLQLAINAAAALNTCVYLPAGTTTVTAKITVPSHTCVEGAGWSTTLTFANSVNNYMFQNASIAGGNTNISFRNMKIDGNYANNPTPPGGDIFDMEKVDNARFENIWITNARKGFRLVTVTNSRFASNYLNNPKDNTSAFNFESASYRNAVVQNVVTGYTVAVNLDGENLTGSQYNIISNNTFYDDGYISSGRTAGDSILISGASNFNTIIGNTIHDYGEDGIRVTDSAANGGASYNTIMGNTLYRITRYGIVAAGGAFPNVGNTITGNTVSSTTNHGIFIDGGSHDNTISGNTVNDSILSGIYLNTSTHSNLVTGNNLNGNGQYGIYSPSIGKNTISINSINGMASTFNGIYVLNSSNNTVNGNTIWDTTSAGFRVQETVAGSTTRNHFSGNTVFSNPIGINLVNDSEDPDFNEFIDNLVYSNTTNYSADPGVNIIVRADRGAYTISSNLGIGTTTASTTLSVQGNGLFSGNIHVANLTATGTATIGSLAGLIAGNAGLTYAAATTTPTFGLGLTSGGTWSVLGAAPTLNVATSSLYSGTTGQFPYFSGTNTLTATSSLFLATSGFVGIGTASAGEVLEVNLGTQANNDVGGILLAGAVGGSVGTTGFYVAQTNSSNNSAGWVRLQRTTGSVFIGLDIGADTRDGMRFMTQDSTGSYANNLIERMRIDASGNVGIGTTSPVSKLSVVGESALAGGLSVGLGYAGTAAPANGLIIQGNIGIGTTNPGKALEISTSEPVLRMTSGAAGGQWDIIAGNGVGATAGNFVIFNAGYGNTPFRIINDAGNLNNNALVISGGNVGIGETAPGSKLSVSGGGSFGASYDTTAAPTNGLIIEGNVGIGTTSPSALLAVQGNGYLTGGLGVGLVNTTAGTIQATSVISTPAYVGSSGTGTALSGFITNTSALTIDTDKVVPYHGISWKTFSDAPGNLSMYMQGYNGIRMYTTGLERVRIDSSGNVGIGTTTPWKTFSVVGTGAWNGLTNAPATASSICIDATTNEIYDNAASSCLVSARRYKHDIIDQGSAMSTVMSLRPRLYKANSDNTEHYGFIAEEVEEVDKRFVDYNKDGTTQSVRYQEMVSLLTKGMQEQQKEIEMLKARLDALEK